MVTQQKLFMIGGLVLERPDVVQEELWQGIVAMLIDKHIATSKREVITTNFAIEGTKAILAKPLGQYSRCDCRIWQPTKHDFFYGKYSLSPCHEDSLYIP